MKRVIKLKSILRKFVYFLAVNDSLLVKGVLKCLRGGPMNSKFLMELYNQQAKMIYFYLRKNGCGHEDAEDIVQDSYMKYMTYSSGVDSDKALGYIFTIALNEFRKNMRKKGREQIIAIDNDYFWNNFSSDQDPEWSVLEIEEKEEITTTLEQMKEDFRILLLLKYDFNLSYKEISVLLGMKMETVRTYLYRARNEFRKIWRDSHE